MDRNDLAVEKFCLVRDAIDQTLYPNAYRMAFKTPFRFYLDHETEESVCYLIARYENPEQDTTKGDHNE